MYKLIGLVALALLLAGCQKSATVKEQSAQSYRQLQGATLVLKEPIRIPPGKARVFLQDGGSTQGTLLGGSFNQYRPHCGFEVQRIDHEGFTIRAGEFRISRVQHSLQPVVMAQPVRLAALQLAGGYDGQGSGGYHEGYHIWLESGDQPEVMRVSCYGVYAERPDLYPPTLEEIRQALGQAAEIRL